MQARANKMQKKVHYSLKNSLFFVSHFLISIIFRTFRLFFLFSLLSVPFTFQLSPFNFHRLPSVSFSSSAAWLLASAGIGGSRCFFRHSRKVTVFVILFAYVKKLLYLCSRI